MSRGRIERMVTAAPRGIWVVLLAGLAKGVAFLREPVVAAVLGASASSDAYYIAVGIPLAIYNVFALPFSQWVTAHLVADEADALVQRRFGKALFVATVVSVCVTIVLGVYATQVIEVYAPGLSGDRLSRAAQLLRIGAFAVPALVLQAVCAGRLYAERRFATAYVWIAVGSVVGFVGVLGLTPRFGALGGVLAFLGTWWTSAVALVLHAGVGRRASSLVSAELPQSPRGVDTGVITRAVVMQLFFQGSAVLVYGFASRLNSGEIAATLFASKIVMAVYETVVLTAGVLVFPEIASALSKRHARSAGDAVLRALNWVLPITVAFMLLLALSRKEIVTLVYRRHAFDQEAVGLVAGALLGYAPYVVGITLVEILHRVLVLRGRLIGYVAVFSGALAGNWLACWLLVPRLGVLGVTIGASLGILLAGLGLWLYAHRRLPEIQSRAVAGLLGRTALAAAVAVGVVTIVRARVHAPANVGGELWLLGVVVVSGIVAFGASLRILGHRWPGTVPRADSGIVT